MTGSNGTGGDGGVVMAGPVMLVWHSRPCPIDLTRRVMVGGKKVAEMQGVGPGPAGGGIFIWQSGKIVTGGADIGIGWPMSLTRGLGTMSLTVPPCAHLIWAAMFNKKPGIT
jgi:hypothetical protein